MDVVDIIGWSGTILMLVGSIINIYKHTWCWPVWIAGGTLIICQSMVIGTWNIVTMQLAYMPLNAYGWIQWRNDETKR
jgi:hypothetical protein